jgi:ABC-2 type transport system permease protein
MKMKTQYFSQIIALALKEFLALFRDKRSRLILVIPPLLQMLIFGFAATYDLDNVPIGIYNQDQGEVSREFISRFEGSDTFEVIKYIKKDSDIAPLIDNKKVLLVLNIEPQFSDKLQQGKSAKVQVILDGRNSNTAMTAMNYIASMNLDFNQQWSAKHGATGPKVGLEVRNWYNENLQSRWFILPGILGSLILVVILLVTALSVAREREAGTFDQLLVTPMNPTQILIGKAIPGIVIGLLESTLILIIIVKLFQIPIQGDIVALYFGLFLFLISATGIGLVISAISLTQQQAVLGAFLFIVPAVVLSGFTTPIANMPDSVQLLTYINPLRYFLIILRGVFLEGNGFTMLLSQFWPMAVIGVVCLVFAGWLFRHRMY